MEQIGGSELTDSAGFDAHQVCSDRIQFIPRQILGSSPEMSGNSEYCSNGRVYASRDGSHEISESYLSPMMCDEVDTARDIL